ncbi:G protein-regulated inducer of neurite outgrowth 3 [Anguilla anguilla]|uniref:G protein-regulated inducer of neurite outgrowth 3 n=1 Tax=Anguilla anguilla TaxID=7936 RepID=UPI0015AA3234|nr:G protein-regulated inducer of neurite outgrowth 3 [Anguilla anguilla]
MGTIPEPKRTVTAETVPQPEPVGSFVSRDSCSSANNKTTLDSKLASVSAAEELPGNLSLKTNDGVIKKSSDNSQPNKRRASNTLTSPTGDHEKSTSTSSAIAKEKSTFTSSTEDHKKSTFTSSPGDHGKSTIISSTGDHGKSIIIPSTGGHGKSTITSSSRDHKLSTLTSPAGDQKTSNIISSTRDHEKSTFTSSTRDREKSTFTSSTRDNEKSTFTSSTADHTKPELLSRKDLETGRDLIGGCVSDVIENHKDSSATVRVLPAAEKEDIRKTSLSVSALTSNLQSNDARGNVQSSTEVLVQSREISAKGAPEYSQPPRYKSNVIQRSDQAFHPTHTSPLVPTTKQEKIADVRTSREDTSLAAQSKDYKESTASLPSVLPSSPVQTGSRPQTSEREATGSILENLQQEKNAKPKSPEAEESKAMSASSARPDPAHKGPSPLKKEVGDSESTSRNHLSVLPRSPSPGGPLSEAGMVSTVGGASQTPDTTAGEDHKAQRECGSRYKEAATMTVSTEHRSTSERSRHDAGVQAVASVSSRSVGTSPGLSSQGGPLKLNGRATEGQERLTVTCQRSSRSATVYQITMDDGWSSQSGILSDVCSQTVLSTQIHGESSHLTSKQICDHLPGQARLKAGQCNSQTAGVNHNSDPALKPDGRGQGSAPKEPADTAQKWLPLLQPVYQINIEPCGQSNVTSNTGPCDKEPPGPGSTCQRKSGTESGTGRQRGERGRFPGNAASNDVCQASADVAALPTRSVGSPAARPSPSQVDGLLPGAPTGVTEKGEVEANPPVAVKQAAGRPNQDPKRHAPQKADGRVCKSGKSEERGKKKEPNPKEGKKQSQTGSGEKGKTKSVHDVVWDEQGMTWEVYGASADPESLGFAIQNHLQSKIKEQERLIKAQVERRRSGVPASPAGKRTKRRQQNVFRSMMKNVRRPKCCARPPPSSVLE